jgi:hypothetical protein
MANLVWWEEVTSSNKPFDYSLSVSVKLGSGESIGSEVQEGVENVAKRSTTFLQSSTTTESMEECTTVTEEKVEACKAQQDDSNKQFFDAILGGITKMRALFRRRLLAEGRDTDGAEDRRLGLQALAMEAIGAFAEDVTPLLIDYGFDLAATAATAYGCPVCGMAIKALKPSGDPEECNPMRLSEEVASCTGTSLSNTQSESQTEEESEAHSVVTSKMRKAFSESSMEITEECSATNLPSGRLYQLQTKAFNSKYPDFARGMGVATKLCSYCWAPFDAGAPVDLPGIGQCGQLDCDGDILRAGTSQVPTGHMIHNQKDAKPCGGGGDISFICEYGKVRVLEDNCQLTPPPTPRQTNSERDDARGPSSTDVTDKDRGQSPDSPDSFQASGGATYVVECESDCSEACYKVVNEEIEAKAGPVCTANDASRGKSCDKCEPESTVANMSFATVFGSALLFIVILH